MPEIEEEILAMYQDPPRQIPIHWPTNMPNLLSEPPRYGLPSVSPIYYEDNDPIFLPDDVLDEDDVLDDEPNFDSLEPEDDGLPRAVYIPPDYPPNMCTCPVHVESWLECQSPVNSGIYEYHYKPLPIFHGSDSGKTLYLGPEIEIEAPGTLTRMQGAEIANNHLGKLGYLKRDGSLNHGFEVVTHPMTYSWAMDNFPWTMLGDLQEVGCETSENCGLHVHVSRQGFRNSCHMYRWINFFYRNPRHIQLIARRHDSDYARFYRQGSTERQNIKYHVKGNALRDSYGDEHYPERYSAINIKNPTTLEIRVFASSLVPVEIKAAFGLADASVEYTRNLTSHQILREDGWTWPAFAAWLGTTEGKYEPLQQEIDRFQKEMDRLCAY